MSELFNLPWGAFVVLVVAIAFVVLVFLSAWNEMKKDKVRWAEEKRVSEMTREQWYHYQRRWFSITHHKITGRYYPKYHAVTFPQFLHIDNGLVYTTGNMAEGLYFSTEEEAWALIDRFVEQVDGGVSPLSSNHGW